MIHFIKFLIKLLLLGPVWSISYGFKPSVGARIQTKILRILGVKVIGPVWFEGVPVIIGFKNLTIGQNVAIGNDAKFIAYGPISIGDGCMFGANVTINSASHNVETLEPYSAPVKIGKRVWVGLNVAICVGVDIGDDTVVGAGSIVLKSIPAGSVAVGVPCKVMRSNNRRGRVFNVFSDIWCR
jgi:acetyltransferase-like isoleucine patch superfamily enzyme